MTLASKNGNNLSKFHSMLKCLIEEWKLETKFHSKLSSTRIFLTNENSFLIKPFIIKCRVSNPIFHIIFFYFSIFAVNYFRLTTSPVQFFWSQPAAVWLAYDSRKLVCGIILNWSEFAKIHQRTTINSLLIVRLRPHALLQNEQSREP